MTGWRRRSHGSCSGRGNGCAILSDPPYHLPQSSEVDCVASRACPQHCLKFKIQVAICYGSPRILPSPSSLIASGGRPSSMETAIGLCGTACRVQTSCMWHRLPGSTHRYCLALPNLAGSSWLVWHFQVPPLLLCTTVGLASAAEHPKRFAHRSASLLCHSCGHTWRRQRR